jgi:uncharacterized protein with HEPN domain
MPASRLKQAIQRSQVSSLLSNGSWRSPGMPWDNSASSIRSVLAHGYATIDHRRVFEAATSKVPALTAIIAKLLDELPPG